MIISNYKPIVYRPTKAKIIAMPTCKNMDQNRVLLCKYYYYYCYHYINIIHQEHDDTGVTEDINTGDYYYYYTNIII